MRPVAVYCDIFAFQRLNHEVADYAPVVQCHTRTIGVEYSGNLHFNVVLAVVIHHEAFCGPFPLVVTASRSYRVDPSPVSFLLRMHVGVSVYLRGRCLENLRIEALRHAEGIDGPHHIGLNRLDRVVLVVHGRSRTGEIIDMIHLEEDRVDDVVPD